MGDNMDVQYDIIVVREEGWLSRFGNLKRMEIYWIPNVILELNREGTTRKRKLREQ